MKRPEGPSLRETLKGVTADLTSAGIESPVAEAERLVATATGIPRPQLALHLSDPLEAKHARALAPLVARRASGEPLQYVEGTAAFRTLTLKADRRALIPRPETEQLVEFVAERLRMPAGTEGKGGPRPVPRPGAQPDPPARRALDIGTGSGAIALSLAAENLARTVVAVDRSRAALQQAAENLAITGVDPSRIEFRHCGDDPYDAVAPGEVFDLLVSNPPYVTRSEVADLPGEITDWEPVEALDGGEDGLSLLRLVISGAARHLEPGGRLFLEFGAAQGAAVEAMLRDGPWLEVRRLRDLAGHDRFVEARRA